MTYWEPLALVNVLKRFAPQLNMWLNVLTVSNAITAFIALAVNVMLWKMALHGHYMSEPSRENPRQFTSNLAPNTDNLMQVHRKTSNTENEKTPNLTS